MKPACKMQLLSIRCERETRILIFVGRKNDWGFTPKQGKLERNVFFLDISRTLPLDATAGYAKVAKLASEEVGAVKELTPESLQDLSYILGQQYGRARFVGTDVDAVWSILIEE